MTKHRADKALGVTASALRAMRWVFAADRGGATRQAIGQIFAAVSSLGLVIVSAVLFRQLLGSSEYDTLAVLGPVFAFAAISGITALITAVSTQRQRLLSERVEQELWRRILHVTAQAPLIAYENDGFITQLARVQQNAVSRPLPTVRAVFSMIGALLTAIALAVALCFFSIFLPLVLLVAAGPSVVIGRLASRSEYRFSHDVVPLYLRRDYWRRTISERTHAAELRALGALDGIRERHDVIDRSMVAKLAKQVRRRAVLAACSSVVSTIGLLAALVAIVALVDTGRMSLAEAGAAAIAARLFAASVTSAYSSLATLTEAAPHLNDLEEFLGSAHPVESVEPVVASVGHADDSLRSEVRVDNVSFRYPSAPGLTLDGVDIVIGHDEVVALVGENGSGKTTLARIVAGLYEPDHGAVLWDGAPRTAADRVSSTSLLSQDFGRYAMTVADNITLGDSRVPPDEELIRAAAKAATFDAVAVNLRNGYATMLGRDVDEGVDLSGGQWQRLGLARALFRGSNLLILDEPSAALDPRAESELFDDVRRVLSGRSALLISHRYASARLADRVYVLHDGRVVESGTHTQLMAAGGRYAELFQLQSAAYLAGLLGDDA